MPAPDDDVRLVSEVQLYGAMGRRQVYIRYAERRYKLGIMWN